MTDDRAVRLALDVAHLTAERDELRAEVDAVRAQLRMAHELLAELLGMPR